jgi:glutamine synthetase
VSMDPQTIRETVKKEEINVIRFFFTDVLGNLKGLNIDVSQLDHAMDQGIQFDGSSVEGFVRIEESDLIAMPDLETFRIFPLSDGGVRSAFFICDVLYPDRRPLESDPRYILRRNLERARAMGFDRFNVGPELEFFYFPDAQTPVAPDSGGYFDVLPLDKSATVRSRTLATLREMGMRMEAAHHEVAAGQHEIDFRYGEALLMADQVVVAKVLIKEIARSEGLYATFMPKPINGVNGSGMHVHQSLFSNGTNAFYSDDGEYNLSEVGRGYIAGILGHAREFTAVTNQCVNSYKRLIPGYEAPVYTVWGRRNRSALVRVPAFRPGQSTSCRVEYRAPDAAANPYLAFAVMLASGLEGIEHGYAFEPPTEDDVYSMTAAERAERRIESLPGDLYGATLACQKSAVVEAALGPVLFEKFIKNKLAEWERYRTHVTDYEIETYLPTL